MLNYLSKFHASQFKLRTPESYDYHCSLLEGELESYNSTTYGLNFNSPLNMLEGFHVANSQLPHDVMHVLLEGVIPYEMSLLLKHFIAKKYLTLEGLNDKIQCFPYSYHNVHNKPSCLNPNLLKGGKPSISHSGEVFCIYN